MVAMFEQSDLSRDLCERLEAFMDQHVMPNEQAMYDELDSGDRWQPIQKMEELKALAKEQGLWNLFLPENPYGFSMSNLDYAPMCEIMGRSPFAPEIFNCSAPDTGNMEVLARYGTKEHQEKWLVPLLNGEIRSAFAMTEPEVASSDATNIECRIERDGGEYVINGRKWCT